MTKMHEIYKCDICGNIVEMLHTGAGELVCCGQPMKLKTENTVDAATEKHVPIIEKNGSKVHVQVGEIDHPMEEEHHIEWIEVITATKTYRKYLQAGDLPKAEFEIDEEIKTVREYCNLHGLWTT